MRLKRNSKGRFVKRKKSRRTNPRGGKAVVAVTRKRRKARGKRKSVAGYTIGTKRIRRRKLNPRRHRARHRRSNPRFNVSGILGQLTPALMGAAGGIALDLAFGYIPGIPASLNTGYPKHATRIVGALGIGYLAKKFLKGRGSAVAAGALTVAVYGLLKDVITQNLPTVKGLGDYEEISIDNTADQIGAYIGSYLPDGSVASGSMGAYIGGPVDDLSDRDGAVLSGMDF